MRNEKYVINREIVESARIFGQWVNEMVYIFAKNQIGKSSKNQEENIKNLKSRILRQIEVDSRNAETPQDMIYRIHMRIGNALKDDIPSQAATYLDAVNSGDQISFREARRMLIMYMRMRKDN